MTRGMREGDGSGCGVSPRGETEIPNKEAGSGGIALLGGRVSEEWCARFLAEKSMLRYDLLPS